MNGLTSASDFAVINNNEAEKMKHFTGHGQGLPRDEEEQRCKEKRKRFAKYMKQLDEGASLANAKAQTIFPTE